MDIKENLNNKNYKEKVGFFSGLILFFLVLYLFPVPENYINSLPIHITSDELMKKDAIRSFKIVLATFSLMVVWWVTEAIPIPATSLLPAVLFPSLNVKGFSLDNIYNFNFMNTLHNYAHPVIGMFLGAFIIASAFQKFELDKRATIWILTRGKIYNNAKITLLALMYTTAIISMWISNTATVAIILPIAIGIINSLQKEDKNFKTALLLGLAWSASIGGIATIVGTPPNGIAISILSKSGIPTINFLDWMKIGIPLMLIFIPIIWLLLIKIFKPAKDTFIDKNFLMDLKENIGKIKKSELIVLTVFLIVVLLWISNPFWKDIFSSHIFKRIRWIDEYLIGLIGGIMLFIMPVKFKNLEFALNWKDTKNIDWGTLILFGGGLALSDAMFKTGLASWMATSFLSIFGSPSTILLLILTVFFIVFMTEVTSNTAITAMMVPVLIAISTATGQETLTLVISAAIAASMAFMLPVATPPNALVYGTGHVKLSHMIKVGFILDIIGWLLTISILYLFGNLIFKIIKI